MALLARRDNDFLEETALKAYEACLEGCGTGYVLLKPDELKRLHPAVFNRVLRVAVNHVKGDLKGIESKHIEDIARLVSRNRTGASIQLPKGIRAGVSYGVLKIYAGNKAGEKLYFSRRLDIPGSNDVAEIGAVMETSVESMLLTVDKYERIGYNSLEQFFDYDRLKEGINIRNRRDGDIFTPHRSNGSKKLKEYFIDNKIPREKRDEIPLIALDNDIVWIIGYKISDKFKVTENTKRVLKLTYKV